MKIVPCLFLLLLCGIVCNCNHSLKTVSIYTDLKLDSMKIIAERGGKDFILVGLLDTNYCNQKKYLDLLSRNHISNESVVIDLVEDGMSNGESLIKILSPQVYPSTCIFSSKGGLIDVVPGDSYESFRSINDVIQKGTISSFHYNQIYGQNKLHKICFFNAVIEACSQMSSGLFIVDKLDSLLKLEHHPYLLYLKMCNQMDFNRVEDAKCTASQLVSLKKLDDIIEYKDEIFKAHNLLDSTYNEDMAPQILCIPDSIQISDAKKGSEYTVELKISNKGEKPLFVYDIVPSCSCLTIQNEKDIVLNHSEQKSVIIKFLPDNTGPVFREIYVVSNSYNNSIYTIPIYADVK